jgi:hypothetical protein
MVALKAHSSGINLAGMPEDATLLKSQRNEIFQIVLELDLNPGDFTWKTSKDTEESARTVSRVEHKSAYYFTFHRKWSDWSPDDQQRYGSAGGAFVAISWLTRLTQVRDWLGYLKREVSSPDLWDSFKESQALQTAATSTNIENAPFTPSELTTVASTLDELKRYITETNQLTNDQIEHLDGQVRYLAEASSRLGRKDWYNILISVLFSVVVSGIFAPDRAQELFQVAAAMFEPLLRSIMQLLA